VAAAKKSLNPDEILHFRDDSFHTLRGEIEKKRPMSVIVVAPPKTVDLTFHLRVMAMCLAVDDDPFPDFQLGYITAASVEEGRTLLNSVSRALAMRGRHPKILAEVGPGIASRLDPGSEAVWCSRLKSASLLHAQPAFLHDNRSILEGAGIIHLFGEASPWGIESGMEGSFLRESKLRLGQAVIVSGESALGTVDFYYPKGIKGNPGRIGVSDSFCLAAISRGPGGMLLSLGPGLSRAAPREIETICLSGGSIGDALGATMNQSILRLGKDDAREFLAEEHWTKPKKVPLNCRAFTRVVFGDPGLTPYPRPLAPMPFSVRARAARGGIDITCVGSDLRKFTTTSELFTETKARDRITFSVPLPKGKLASPRKFEVKSLKSGKRFPKIAFARAGIERTGDRQILHVLVLLDAMGGESVFSGGRKVEGRFRLTE
jgi:hypothetical protein